MCAGTCCRWSICASFSVRASVVAERSARALVINSDEYPVGLIVDEVFGFRRFLDSELNLEVPETVIRADRFLDGCFRRADEVWPVFSLSKLLDARDFQRAAGE